MQIITHYPCCSGVSECYTFGEECSVPPANLFVPAEPPVVFAFFSDTYGGLTVLSSLPVYHLEQAAGVRRDRDILNGNLAATHFFFGLHMSQDNLTLQLVCVRGD